ILENVKIYNNVIKNSGWEAIQVGSTPGGVDVYNNKIENFGVKNVVYQRNGVQFGEGAPGKFYNNLIKGGKGIGLFILSNGQNTVYNNIIINTVEDGIFCDDRTATGPGFKFVNNTIINPGTNGIRLYSDLVSMNNVYNNIIVNPGKYSSYTYPRTGNDAYVYLLSKTMRASISNNYFTRDLAAVKFVNAAAYNYALTSTSPAVNKGYNISTYSIPVDYAQQPRLKGTSYDIGAYEF
ncbi:MAG TPA: right-handed parallel beta-helix repeat-containing protein, partial [Chryseosolibacter sp.]